MAKPLICSRSAENSTGNIVTNAHFIQIAGKIHVRRGATGGITGFHQDANGPISATSALRKWCSKTVRLIPNVTIIGRSMELGKQRSVTHLPRKLDLQLAQEGGRRVQAPGRRSSTCSLSEIDRISTTNARRWSINRGPQGRTAAGRLLRADDGIYPASIGEHLDVEAPAGRWIWAKIGSQDSSRQDGDLEGG